MGLLAAAIEQNHDDKGVLFPTPIAPYHVHIVGLNLSDANVAKAADGIYESLWKEGIECLYDDRLEETAGVKFNDADLLGLPVRLVVSQRTLKTDSVELKRRGEESSALAPLDSVAEKLKDLLSA